MLCVALNGHVSAGERKKETGLCQNIALTRARAGGGKWSKAPSVVKAELDAAAGACARDVCVR
jgi:hypothetical protein